MALIKCEDCGKEFSDTTEKCIHCGTEIKNEKDTKEIKKDNNNKNKFYIFNTCWNLWLCSTS